jgi:hypothetical protein
MKPLFLALLLSAVSLVPAHAGNEGTPVPAAEALADNAVDEPSREKLELAEKMHDVWPIRPRIEAAYDSVAEGFPPERQAEVKAALRKATNFDEMEEASIKAMANLFTVEELKAMIDFYGSDTGRSISAKTPEYEAALRPSVDKMINKAMMDLRVGSQQ